ncbi:ubiquitin carboxyl-terminal hydrolase 44/49, partial [Mytilus galloprovincialis]
HIEVLRDFFRFSVKQLSSRVATPENSPTGAAFSVSPRPSIRMLSRQTTTECFQYLNTKTPSTPPTPKLPKLGGLNGGSSGSSHSTPVNKQLILNVEDCSREKISMCQELNGLFRVLWSGRWAQVSPHAFLHSVWHAIPAFKGHAQHDAQEFLCELLDKLEKELDDTEGQKHSNILTRTFQGKLVSQLLPNIASLIPGTPCPPTPTCFLCCVCFSRGALSSGTYNLDQEPVQIADEADTEIALMPSEIFDSVSCETSHTIVEELHDQPPCLYPETIIQVNPCNVNVTPHKDENKQSCEKAPSSSFGLLLVTPSEQKTLKKKKTRTVLPKAVSGSEMIKILKNRKQQKEDEQEMKEKRKIDRELKRKLKEEENAKKEEKKNEKKKRMEENKKRKLSKKQKKSEKSTTSRLCSKCLLETDDVYICCEICSSFYHAKCSGVDFSCVHIDDIVSFPYECDDCL